MIDGTRYRVDRAIARQNALQASISRGQSDIATNKRLQVASDDPSAAGRIAQLRAAQIDVTAWMAVADYGTALAQRADSALGAATDTLDRARELVTSAISDTAPNVDRAAVAQELRTLADELDATATLTDSTNQRVFPDGAVPLLPVSKSERVAATLSRTEAFTVTTTTGSRDMATILRDAANALASGTQADRSAALKDITDATDHMSAMRGLIGLRAFQMERVQTRLTDKQTDNSEEVGKLEETDVAATISRINADQLALEASQALFAKVNQKSLFDLLA